MGWGKRRGAENKKGGIEKGEFERERDSTFSLNFSESEPWFQAEQEKEIIFTARASHRDRNQGVSTNSKR